MFEARAVTLFNNYSYSPQPIVTNVVSSHIFQPCFTILSPPPSGVKCPSMLKFADKKNPHAIFLPPLRFAWLKARGELLYFSPRLCLIFSGRARAGRCERGPVSCRNQSGGCSRFSTQLLASLRPAPLLLFPATEARGSVACPSVILIASGTVATSVGDGLGRLVTGKRKEGAMTPSRVGGVTPLLAPPRGDLPRTPSRTGCQRTAGRLATKRQDAVFARNRCALQHLWQHSQIVTLFTFFFFFWVVGGGSMTAFCPKNDPF